MSPRGTLEIPAPDGPSHAGAALGAACGHPSLACLQKPRGEKEVETEDALESQA